MCYFTTFRKFVFLSLYKLYQTDKKAADTDNDINSQQKKTRLEIDCRGLEHKETETVTKIISKSDNAHQKRLAQNYLDWIQKAVIK